MKQRLIGGFFVCLVTIITFFSPSYITALCLIVISSMAQYEFLKVYHLDKSPFFVLNLFGTAGLYINLWYGSDELILPLLIMMLVVMLVIYVGLFPKYHDRDIACAYFAFIYISVLLSYVFRIREDATGALLCPFILISSWGNDVFAYLVGSAIGKHKCTPNVSPNKSVEGFIGGILGAGALGYLYALLIQNLIGFPPVYCAMIAALGAIPGDIGDLAASAIKRDNQIKDFSNLIPGHGGMVDRIDSVLYTAPIIYYLVVWFEGI